MRIGLDVRWLQRALHHAEGSLGGIGTYTANLVGSMLRCFPESEFVLFVAGDVPIDERLMGLAAHHRRTAFCRLPGLSRMCPPGSVGKLAAALWERWAARPLMERQGLDGLHALHHGAPLPRAGNCAWVVTVHDLIPLVFPRLYYRSLWTWQVDLFLARQVRWADAILADSQNTKADVVRLLGARPEQVQVVPLGVAPHFRPLEDGALIQRTKARYGIEGRYLLHVGGLGPTKNIGGLMRAFRLLLDRGLGDWELVVVADFRFPVGARDGFAAQVCQLGLHEHIVRAGGVSDDELVALYNGADLFICPSLYEGFGLPVLEAMASGCPAVVSQRASLPEVAGDAALLVDGATPESLAEALAQALSEPALRQSLRARGLERARLFSWTQTAQQTYAVYQRAANR